MHCIHIHSVCRLGHTGARELHAARLCQCWVWRWAERGGPSGHPCHAMFPVKCCQRGLCGLLWRRKACSTALPAQAADLRKGNLGRSNGGVAPELFTEPCAGPAPPIIFHMRTSACGACSAVCVWVGGGNHGCWCECECFYKEIQALTHVCRLVVRS